MLEHFAACLQQQVSESTRRDDQQRQTQRPDENGFAAPRTPKRGRIGKYAVDSHVIGDVLHLAVPERLVSADQLVFDLLVDAARNKHFARLGNPQKAREYLRQATQTITKAGKIPELYYSNTEKPNENTPLGWSESMYVVALFEVK